MRIKYLIAQFATNPSFVRLGMFALTLVLGVIWGEVQRDSIIWGD